MPKEDKSLNDIKPLVLGGAVFNYQYNDDPEDMNIVDILKHGIESGLVNCIDTSPYYGPSEILLGQSIATLQEQHGLWTNRDEYYIITKCGRLKLDDFDYSPQWIRKSVLRSIERLKCGYLDCVYLHDIEFRDEVEIMEALKELHKLKEEDKLILNFGVSGYPIDFLHKIAVLCVESHEIGALDCILSYCHGCLQNNSLFSKANKMINEGHLKLLSNGSILSMSLLSGQKIKEFHPCSLELKQVFDTQVKTYCEREGINLAELSTKYAIAEFHSVGPTVIGVSNVSELQTAIDTFRSLQKQDMLLSATEHKHVEHIQNEILGDKFMNMTWSSGKH
ncbi:hypothetical protein ACO0QE_001994 [Hanseniaspora vineae]